MDNEKTVGSKGLSKKFNIILFSSLFALVVILIGYIIFLQVQYNQRITQLEDKISSVDTYAKESRDASEKWFVYFDNKVNSMQTQVNSISDAHNTVTGNVKEDITSIAKAVDSLIDEVTLIERFCNKYGYDFLGVEWRSWAQ